MDDLKIFSGNANRPLAEKICKHLGIPLGDAVVGRFSDGEISVEFRENVRGKDVYVIQPTSIPCNENLMELLVMMDALKRASARCVTAVVTYFAYARQDRKTAPRTPISAKLLADLITTAGAQRMLTMDLHSGQIQGFFNIPVDHLFAAPVILEYIKENFGPDAVVVSPDAGGVERARAFAKRLNTSLAIIDKRRDATAIKAMTLIGNVWGKEAIILDDMITSGATLTMAAELLDAPRGAHRPRLRHPPGHVPQCGEQYPGLLDPDGGGDRYHSADPGCRGPGKDPGVERGAPPGGGHQAHPQL